MHTPFRQNGDRFPQVHHPPQAQFSIKNVDLSALNCSQVCVSSLTSLRFIAHRSAFSTRLRKVYVMKEA